MPNNLPGVVIAHVTTLSLTRGAKPQRLQKGGAVLALRMIRARETMTLVTSLSSGGLPAFIGDLVILWKLPNPADLPTHLETLQWK